MNQCINRKIAQAACEAFLSGDPVRIYGFLKENAEWLSPSENAISMALDVPNHLIGRDAIVRYLSDDIPKLFVDILQDESHGIYADGDVVIIEKHIKARLINGVDFDNDYCYVLTIDQGKVLSVREYMNTLLAGKDIFG